MTVELPVVEFREEQKKTNARLDAMQTDLLQICDQMGHLSQQAKDPVTPRSNWPTFGQPSGNRTASRPAGTPARQSKGETSL